jgi:hypothetical protein
MDKGPGANQIPEYCKGILILLLAETALENCKMRAIWRRGTNVIAG